LSDTIAQALAADDSSAVDDWIADSETHMEDTELSDTQTALILAVGAGSLKCVELLMEAGASVNAWMVS
jgi:hypothetical protein